MESKDDKLIGIATVKHGDLTLKNIFINEYEYDGELRTGVNFPAKKSSDEQYYPVYEFDGDYEKAIKEQLVSEFQSAKKEYKETNERVNRQDIKIEGLPSATERIHVFPPHVFPDGNKAFNFRYGEVVVNSAKTKVKDGEEKIYFPFRQKSDGEIDNIVNAPKEVKDEIMKKLQGKQKDVTHHDMGEQDFTNALEEAKQQAENQTSQVQDNELGLER